MEEEIENKPKKKRKRKEEVSEEIPIVSDGNEEEENSVEIVDAIEIQNLESLLVPEIIEEDDSHMETMGNEVSLIIPEDKMAHRKISMQCNSCFISDNCPQFKEDSDCTIEWSRLFNGEFTPTDLVQSSVAVLDLQLMRINRAATFEAVNQGILDPELTRNIQIYFEMMKMFKDLSERPQPTISITAKGTATQKGGVLSQLLGLK
jgi:hypothetical protein